MNSTQFWENDEWNFIVGSRIKWEEKLTSDILMKLRLRDMAFDYQANIITGGMAWEIFYGQGTQNLEWPTGELTWVKAPLGSIDPHKGGREIRNVNTTLKNHMNICKIVAAVGGVLQNMVRVS